MGFDVVAIGELLIDFTCNAVDKDGYPTLSAHPGGAPANFLAALAKCGCRTALIGKVGNDLFGRALQKTLAAAKVDTSGLQLDDACFTTLAFVSLNEAGDREFSFARKPGADTMLRAEELRLELIDGAKVFHFGTLSLTDDPSREATRSAVLCAKSKGKLISFDPNLRKPLWKDLQKAREEMLWGLAQADIVKISEEEVSFLFALTVEEGAERIIRDFGCKLVFVTCGADGCFYASRKYCGKVPALQGIQTVDTTGAGDIFGGFVLGKILECAKQPEELTQEESHHAVEFACVAAGLSTTKYGGISSIPEIADCEKCLGQKNE